MATRKLMLICLLAMASSAFALPQKMVVILDWFINPDHAPLFVAEQQGFFAAVGLDVELVGPSDPSDPPKLVAAGKADIAVTFQPTFLQQVDQGLPLVMIGSLIDKPLTSIVTLKESGIHSIEQLKGKKIGTSSANESIALKILLKEANLTLGDVEVINTHYGLTQSLLSKNVDAVTGMMRNFELIQLELAGHPGMAFYPEKNGVPTYSELIFVTQKNHAHDPRLQKFLQAVQAGEHYLQAHPESSWLGFAKAHPELNNELNKRAWIATLPYFAKNPSAINEKQFNAFAEFMYKNGITSKVVYNTSGSTDNTKE